MMKKNLFVKLCTLFLIMLFSTPAVFATVLKFAQISDIHYQPKAPKDEKSFKLKYYSLKFLDDAAEQIKNEKDVKFILVTGDAADKPLVKDFDFIYRYLNKVLPKPWYYCLGNHDVAINGELSKAKQTQLLNEINPKGFGKGKTYYSFTPKRDMTFIGLDATYDTKITSQGYLPPEQLKFVDNTIKNAKDDVIVIFLHHPLTYPAQASDHNVINDTDFKKILTKYDNPILVIGGHFHACKVERVGDNIVEVASPALVSYPNAFRFFTIDNQKDKTIFTIDYRETTHKDLQALAKQKLTWGHKWVYGNATDRLTTITIDKKCKCKTK